MVLDFARSKLPSMGTLVNVALLLAMVANIWINILLAPPTWRLFGVSGSINAGFDKYIESATVQDQQLLYESASGAFVADSELDPADVAIAGFNFNRDRNNALSLVEFWLPQSTLMGNAVIQLVATDYENQTVANEQTMYLVPSPDFALFRGSVRATYPVEPYVLITGINPQLVGERNTVPLEENRAIMTRDIVRQQLDYLNTYSSFFFIQFVAAVVLLFLVVFQFSNDNKTIIIPIVAGFGFTAWFFGFCVGSIANNTVYSLSDYLGELIVGLVFLMLTWLLVLSFSVLLRGDIVLKQTV